MFHHRFALVVPICLVGLLACGPGEDSASPMSTNGVEAPAGSSAVPQYSEAEPYYQASLTIHNLQFGPGSSCEKSRMGPVGTMTCGYPVETSEVSWEFVEHRDGKDIYTFERRFPIDTAEVTTETKQVEFEGEAVTVFEDDAQRVVVEGE